MDLTSFSLERSTCLLNDLSTTVQQQGRGRTVYKIMLNKEQTLLFLKG
jgi:hypothetical protein